MRIGVAAMCNPELEGSNVSLKVTAAGLNLHRELERMVVILWHAGGDL